MKLRTNDWILGSMLAAGMAATLPSQAQERMSLAGKWAVQLDADSAYFNRNTPPRTFQHTMQLPGTTDQARIGQKTTGSDYGILTRAYKHVGPAWYRRQITVPAGWAGKEVSLFLERVLWESRVFIDGKEISRLSPLYVPHRHTLGKLAPGTHTIDICVNNDLIHNIGDKGHGYTEYTQSIWNGIVGRLELLATPAFSIERAKFYPDAEKMEMRVEVMVKSDVGTDVEASIVVNDPKTGKVVKNTVRKLRIPAGDTLVAFAPVGWDHVRLWDEFSPNLYDVKVELKQGKNAVVWNDKIGFRKVSASRNKILVNGKATFVRGNLDCVHFPLTGYPSCDVKEWERIFKKYQEFGLNTVRFHSWTPPRAAFEAADKMGIYIQTEIIWLDWWMAGEQKTRPEMNTKNYPQGLGKNPSADAFVQAEMKRVIDEYGNHPSFLFFCIGNELGNSDFDVMQKWIEKAKADDPRRLYSVSTARKIMPVDDYMVTHNIPEVGGTYGYSMNKTDAGLEANYSRANIPVIAHEVGQAPVHPLWSEIGKYTGVLKARNLEGFRDMALKNGVASQDKDFHSSTGKLQQLLYKNLIENIQLAPSSAGFQLLSLQDYQGQGEALIGWLDCFWDDKGITSAKDFRGYSNAVVPLVRTPTFTYTHADTLRMGMEVANFFKSDLNGPLLWEITDAAGQKLHSGKARQSVFPQGALTKADSLNLPLGDFPGQAGQYTFRLYFADNKYSNSWQFFVFPPAEKHTVNTDGIYVSDAWNHSVDSVLAKGGKVLLLADKLGNKRTSAPVSFAPLFWSASFFPGQSNETLGSRIDTSNEAFRHFPTSDFTNWQWFRITPGAKYFKLTGMPAAYTPIAQPVSDFHFNEKLGSIFETRIGAGKLLVCGYNLRQPANAYAHQLYYSLVQYMNSAAFSPKSALPEAWLKEILAQTEVAAPTSPLPNEFNGAALFISAGRNASASKDWAAEDDAVIASKGYKYSATGLRTIRRDSVSAWAGRNFSIQLQPPAGVKGYVYLHLLSGRSGKASGLITIEGRELKTGDIPATGKWIKIFMMREDTNDGKVAIQFAADNNSGLVVDQLVVMEEE
ncbi:glycoside hydrolase family 2 TIM barrel-domain containing protein [Chitinophaga caseinilytica]|uniref:glycoside hydrolase family 2 TIM barrel-domain containing protein n=1 Tax=Chitinophaga caseinilytica TaxID=2267521 RepID=UPI003C2E33BE